MFGQIDVSCMQEFSADMNSRAVKRIEDVSRLRQAQFPEDAGSMAHPIRPDSYVRMGTKPLSTHFYPMLKKLLTELPYALQCLDFHKI